MALKQTNLAQNRPVFKIAALCLFTLSPASWGHTCWETVVLLSLSEKTSMSHDIWAGPNSSRKGDLCCSEGSMAHTQAVMDSPFHTHHQKVLGCLPPLQRDCSVLEDSIIPFLFYFTSVTMLTFGIIHTGFPNKRSSLEMLSPSCSLWLNLANIEDSSCSEWHRRMTNLQTTGYSCLGACELSGQDGVASPNPVQCGVCQ